ncbi:unnamed protein product, partial [Closterium sp. NIES-54]
PASCLVRPAHRPAAPALPSPALRVASQPSRYFLRPQSRPHPAADAAPPGLRAAPRRQSRRLWDPRAALHQLRRPWCSRPWTLEQPPLYLEQPPLAPEAAAPGATAPRPRAAAPGPCNTRPWSSRPWTPSSRPWPLKQPPLVQPPLDPEQPPLAPEAAAPGAAAPGLRAAVPGSRAAARRAPALLARRAPALPATGEHLPC